MPGIATERSVDIGPLGLCGDLVTTDHDEGIVVFAHGSGSSRRSPRNRYVAGVLQESGFATLLVDLLTATEERSDVSTGQFRFDIELLSERLRTVAEWVGGEQVLPALPIGYFGASTGAGAALLAAARHPTHVAAIVSRGGRPDLAGAFALSKVQAPTLLIAGSSDEPVIDLNRKALGSLRCEKELVIVPGATHLFEEPGTLDEVARLAAAWFRRHLKK